MRVCRISQRTRRKLCKILRAQCRKSTSWCQAALACAQSTTSARSFPSIGTALFSVKYTSFAAEKISHSWSSCAGPSSSSLFGTVISIAGHMHVNKVVVSTYRLSRSNVSNRPWYLSVALSGFCKRVIFIVAYMLEITVALQTFSCPSLSRLGGKQLQRLGAQRPTCRDGVKVEKDWTSNIKSLQPEQL